MPSPASVIDFGAGTGRLALPLADGGYRITAVDASRAMLGELERKAARAGLDITSQAGRLQDLRDFSDFDMSLCIFSVLSYLLMHDDLERALEAISRATAAGGHALLDVPERLMFCDQHYETPVLHREISITPTVEDTFRYRESTRLQTDDRLFAYTDEFDIRWWHPEHVVQVAGAQGLLLEADLTEEFAGTGARYFLLRRQ
jgi:SAM-dependent methyltransferase